MATRKLSDSDVEVIIDLWQTERSLWDVSAPSYANRDAAKAARKRIGDAVGICEGMYCFLRVSAGTVAIIIVLAAANIANSISSSLSEFTAIIKLTHTYVA
jgi:hypothetical protein